MTEKIVVDVGDINLSNTAEVRLTYQAINWVPGQDGSGCGIDTATCAGTQAFRQSTAPQLVRNLNLTVQPNDLYKNSGDIWINDTTGEGWVLLEGDETGDGGCAAGEAFDTALGSCVTLIDDSPAVKKRTWRPVGHYFYMPDHTFDSGEI